MQWRNDTSNTLHFEIGGRAYVMHPQEVVDINSEFTNLIDRLGIPIREHHGPILPLPNSPNRILYYLVDDRYPNQRIYLDARDKDNPLLPGHRLITETEDQRRIRNGWSYAPIHDRADQLRMKLESDNDMIVFDPELHGYSPGTPPIFKRGQQFFSTLEAYRDVG